MKLNIFKITFSAFFAVLSAYFGKILVPVTVLFSVMMLDYISGMLKAYLKAELNSKIGIKGIIKKLSYLMIVLAAAAFDFILIYYGESIGLNLGKTCLFSLLVTVWLIINEIISIIENLIELGVPVPEFFKKAILNAKHKIDNENEKE